MSEIEERIVNALIEMYNYGYEDCSLGVKKKDYRNKKQMKKFIEARIKMIFDEDNI